MPRSEAESANDSIKQALLNPDHVFSEDELQTLIDNQFSENTEGVDATLIDLAASRLLLLQGKALTEENIRQVEEQNAKRVLSQVLGIAE